MVYWILRVLSLFFYRIAYWQKIYGKENLIKKGKNLVVCNHYGIADVFFISTLYHSKTMFMAKKEWFSNKFTSWIFRQVGAIPVDRDAADIMSVKNCMRVLKDDKRLCVFPEGTRNKSGTDELQPIKGGAGVMAFKCDAKIVPVVMLKKFKPFRINYAYVGKPFDFEEFKGQRVTAEVNDKMTEIMTQKLNEAREELKKILEKKGK